MLNNNYGKRLHVTCLKTSVMSSLTGDSRICLSASAASHSVLEDEGNRTPHDGKLEKEGLCGTPSPLGPQGPQTTVRTTAFEKRIKYMNRKSLIGQTTWNGEHRH